MSTQSEDRAFASRGLSETERSARESFYKLFRSSPIPDWDVLSNLGLYVRRQLLMRMLFMQELYLKALNVHGCMIEFGVRFGQNLALWQNFRGIYEPYNIERRIIGFDTFEGLRGSCEKDGTKAVAQDGTHGVGPGYENHLDAILSYHECESPISHLRRYEIVKGDATETLPEWLKQNPHMVIALAYFDFDLYLPTKDCLLLIMDRLTKGSVIGFDEICRSEFPGETRAVMEVLGMRNIRLQRSTMSGYSSYTVVE